VYTVSVRRSWEAHHYLIGAGGTEGRPHQHRYAVTVTMEGYVLDACGYLVDITAVEKILDRLAVRYRGKLLNDLPEFGGLNPSIEHFARLICHRVCRRMEAPGVTAVTARVAENEDAWASYRSVIDASRSDRL
jgi:6-pyruvoyltetrahydropterin/6-carboxytetrahydropterin synthase